MREIKFKAWDKVTNSMLGEDDPWKLWLNGGVSISETWATGDVILLQYTGIKDADGDELYEGDAVVPLKNPKGNPEYYFTPYKIAWIDHKWKLMNRLGSTLNGGTLWNKSVKWIKVGNIYESEDILNRNVIDFIQQQQP